MKKKDNTVFIIFLFFGLLFLNGFVVNKLLFFIPESYGWVNEGERSGKKDLFMPLKSFLSFLIAIVLTCAELYLYFRKKKKKKKHSDNQRPIA